MLKPSHIRPRIIKPEHGKKNPFTATEKCHNMFMYKFSEQSQFFLLFIPLKTDRKVQNRIVYCFANKEKVVKFLFAACWQRMSEFDL